ncbi:hypothetical protein RDABS01_026203 [Bienertia sinuspersici]
MLVVEELYKEAVANTTRTLIVFNGELDRIRSGYYPSFFYPKLASLTKTLLPKMETVSCQKLHSRCILKIYGNSSEFLKKVLRRMGNTYACVHQRENYAIPEGSCLRHSSVSLIFAHDSNCFKRWATWS